MEDAFWMMSLEGSHFDSFTQNRAFGEFTCSNMVGVGIVCDENGGAVSAYNTKRAAVPAGSVEVSD